MPDTEYERRLVAIGRVQAGETVVSVARALERTEQWLHKWLRRYEAQGEAGLRDRSRASKHPPSGTPARVVARVLAVRDNLEASEHGGIGAEAVRYELELRGSSPSRRSRPSSASCAGPGIPLGPSGPDRRSGIVPARWSLPRGFSTKATGSAPGTWPADCLSTPCTRWMWAAVARPPSSSGIGGWSTQRCSRPSGPGRHSGSPWPRRWTTPSPRPTPPRVHPFNLFVRTCLLFGVEVVVSPPNELGWMNHVESFNALWQARTIRRHRYRSVDEVAASSSRFVDYYMTRRPHPGLSVGEHGARFPAEVLEESRPQLRFPPEGFTLEAYRQGNGKILLPISRGRLTFLRRVDEQGSIEVGGTRWRVGATYAGLCVAATVSTYHRRLRVRLDGKVLREYRFPVPGNAVAPWIDPAPRGLFYDLTG